MGRRLHLNLKTSRAVFIGLFLAFMLATLMGGFVYADDGAIGTNFFGGLKDDGKGCGVYMMLNLVIDTLTIGVGIASAIGIVLSGITYLTAGGNEARTVVAKKRIYEIVIGLAVFVVLWAFLNFLLPGGILNNSTTCEQVDASGESSWVNPAGKRSLSTVNRRATNRKNKNNRNNKNNGSSSAVSKTAQKILALANEYASKFQSSGIRYLHSNGWSSWGGVKNSGYAICHSLVNIVAKEAGILKSGGKLRLGKGKILGGSGSLVKDKVKIRTNVNEKLSTLVKKGQLLPGDIVGAEGNEHSMIYKGYQNGKYVFLTAGRQATNTEKKYGRFVADKIKNHSSYSGSYKVGVIIRAK